MNKHSQCNNCSVPHEQKMCHRVTELSNEYRPLEIKSDVLAHLIQTQQLTIDDFKCPDKTTKQYIQAVMLNCILCKATEGVVTKSANHFIK